MSVESKFPQVIRCNGGLGNLLCGLYVAHACGLPCTWVPQGPFLIEDILENPEAVTVVPGMDGWPTWMYPHVRPALLGTPDHHPNHYKVRPSNHFHSYWTNAPKNPYVRPLGEGLTLRPCPTFDIPDNCTGVHVRLLHPGARDLTTEACVRKINELAEQEPVFVCSDVPLQGLSDSVVVSDSHKLQTDLRRDRDQVLGAYKDFHTLGKCAKIVKSLPGSSFADHWVFVRDKPLQLLF